VKRRKWFTEESPQDGLEAEATDGINPSADAVNILRIEIEDIEPLIWWRVAVRSSTNLTDLHKVIQVAMGWVHSQRAPRRFQ
jgi:Plasmid pRiA4b ORF-3-like protein